MRLRSWKRAVPVLLLIALFAVPLLTYAQEALTETFTSSDGSSSVRHPAGWTGFSQPGFGMVIGTSQLAISAVTSAQGAFSAGDRAVLIVTDYPFDQMMGTTPPTVEAAAQALADSVRSSQISDLVANPPASITISTGQGPAPAALVEASSQSRNIAYYMVVWELEGNYALFAVLAPIAEMSAFEPTALAMLESFQYDEPVYAQRGAIAFGTTVEGTLEANVAGDEWTFTAQGGEFISAGVTSEFDNTLTLLDSAGREWATDDDSGGMFNALISNFPIVFPGEYTLRVRSYDGATGGYSLSLSVGSMTVAVPTAVAGGTPIPSGELRLAGPIAVGETVTATLENQEGDNWTLTGSAGDVISIAVTAAFDNTVALLDSAGSQIAFDDDSGGNRNALISGVTLPASGQYTIRVRPYFEGSGQYTLSVTEGVVSPVVSSGFPTATPFPTELMRTPGPIAYGETAGANFANPAGDDWTFSGQAGEVVRIAVVADWDNTVALLSSSGLVLARDDDSGGNLNALIGGFRLPTTGTYTIRVDSFSDSTTGPYLLTLETITVPEPGPMQYGDIAESVLFDPSGDEWTFEGQQGDVVTIILISDFFPNLQLLDAQGQELAASDEEAFEVARIDRFTLPASGTYTIVVSSAFQESGAYTLVLGRPWEEPAQ